MKKQSSFTIHTSPSSRLFTTDIGRLGMKKHHIKAMIELDVTLAREKISVLKSQSHCRTSFTSWIMKCIAQAVSEHKNVHALRKGGRRVIIFDEIDISMMVEREVQGERVPLPMVLRDVGSKTIEEIFDEIESAKSQKIAGENKFVLGRRKKKDQSGLFALLPQCIRLPIWKILLSSPRRVKAMMGTVIVTSVGMMGEVRGWFVPYSIHPLCFALGSIIKKPAIVGGEVCVREFLQMTVLIDHDVVDGAPAARFIARLKELIEGAALL